MRFSRSERGTPSNAACSAVCATRKSLASRIRIGRIVGFVSAWNKDKFRRSPMYNKNWRAGRVIAGLGVGVAAESRRYKAGAGGKSGHRPEARWAVRRRRKAAEEWSAV